LSKLTILDDDPQSQAIKLEKLTNYCKFWNLVPNSNDETNKDGQ